jgi:hypothetical protein
MVDTSPGGLLVSEDIIRPMVDTSVGGLLVPEDIIRPMVDTSAGELLVQEDIIRPITSYGTNSPPAEVSKHCADNILWD